MLLNSWQYQSVVIVVKSLLFRQRMLPVHIRTWQLVFACHSSAIFCIFHILTFQFQMNDGYSDSRDGSSAGSVKSDGITLDILACDDSIAIMKIMKVALACGYDLN